MRILRSLFDFYINASIHVALSVTSISLITLWVFDISQTPEILFFIFFASITGYNFIKYARMAGLHHRSLADGLKLIQLFSFFCMGCALYFLFQLSREIVVISGLFATFTLLYALPFFNKRSLRTISGLKIFVVALVWAGVTVFLPLVTQTSFEDADMWIHFSEIFLLVIVWTLVFEIRDLPYDAKGLKTIPQVIGIKGTKKLGIVVLGLVVLLEGFRDDLSQAYFISLFITVSISGILLLLAQKKQPKYFASFIVESIPIVWMLIFLFLRNAFI